MVAEQNLEIEEGEIVVPAKARSSPDTDKNMLAIFLDQFAHHPMEFEDSSVDASPRQLCFSSLASSE